MEHKIISTKKNEGLERQEFVLTVEAGKNPTKKEIIEILKTEDGLTIVKKIRGSFGKGHFDVEAVVYATKEARDRIEVTPRKIRKKAAEEAKKAAEAAKAAGGAK